MNSNQQPNIAISVALPAWNSSRTLKTAIESILWQTFPNWELLLMDDGSEDGTLDIVSKFREPRIRIVADSVHRGLPAQLNRAVELARGRYFARMDADDIAYPSRFEKQVGFLDSHPEVDLIGGWMTVFRSDGTLLGARRPPATHEEICAQPWGGLRMAHPTWMGRTEWFRRNPYRTDSIRMEDWELLLRTYSSSRFANVQEVVLGYREDSLSLRRLLQARKNICKLAAEYAAKKRNYLLALQVVAGQAVRGAADLAALSTGLGHKVLRHRALQATPAEAQEWKQLWETLAAHTSDAEPTLSAGKTEVAT